MGRSAVGNHEDAHTLVFVQWDWGMAHTFVKWLYRDDTPIPGGHYFKYLGKMVVSSISELVYASNAKTAAVSGTYRLIPVNF